MIIIFYILLLVFERRANEYPPIMYGVIPYGYNTLYQPTTVAPESEESSEEENDSDEYVTCTCETCGDVSCEEYCKTCSHNSSRKYKERTYGNIQYANDKNNILENNYRRLALRTVEASPTNYKVDNSILNTMPKELIDDENKEIYRPNADDTSTITYKQNEIQTDFDNSIVKLTYNKAQNDKINIEFLLNDREKVLNEETYVNTPIRRTKLNINKDLANTHYRNMKMLHS